MIFDGENLFLDKKTLSAGTIESNIVNVGPGETYQPMFLVTLVQDGTKDGAATVTLKTSAKADMSDAVTLGSYAKLGSQPVPRGNLGYLQLSVESTYTGGTMTAGLVVDDDVKHRQ